MRKKIICLILLIATVLIGILVKMQLNSNATNYNSLETAINALLEGELNIGDRVSISNYPSISDTLQCIEEDINGMGSSENTGRYTFVSDLLNIDANNPATVDISNRNASNKKVSKDSDAARLAIYAYLQNYYDFDKYAYQIWTNPLAPEGYGVRRRYASEILFKQLLKDKKDIWDLGYYGRATVADNTNWFYTKSEFYKFRRQDEQSPYIQDGDMQNRVLDLTMSSMKEYIDEYANLAVSHENNKNTSTDKLEITGNSIGDSIVLNVPVRQKQVVVYSRRHVTNYRNITNEYVSDGNVPLVTGIVFRIKPYSGETLITDFSIKSGSTTYKECTNLAGSVKSELEKDSEGTEKYCFYTTDGTLNGTKFFNWQNGFEVVPTNSNIQVTKVEIEYGYILYGAKYAILDASTQAGGNVNANCFQSQTIFLGDRYKTVKSGTLDIEIGDTLTIQKTSNGSNLSKAGIKFNVYEDSNYTNKVGELTTTNNGKTNSMKISRKTYYIEEVLNNYTWYKGNNGLKKSVNASSGGNIIFNFDNTPSYANINIHKVDPNDNDLSNVGFKIKVVSNDGNTTQYLRVIKGSEGPQTEIEGQVDFAIDPYVIAYVNSEADATTFVTDSNGKISIKNLEKYYAKDKLFKYVAKEIYNNNLGFNVEGNVEFELTHNSTNKIVNSPKTLIIQKTSNGNNLAKSSIKFNIYEDNSFSELLVTATTDVSGKTQEIPIQEKLYYIEETENNIYGYKGNAGTIKSINTASNSFDGTFMFDNTPSYENIKIIKEDQNNTKLKNVEFKIKIVEGTTTKYLRLADNAGNNVTSVIGSATINKDNVANNDEYKVEYVASETNATVFKTNENGVVEINNLEKYYCTKEYNSTTGRYSYTQNEFEYIAKETSNSNYGFKSSTNLNIEQILTVNGQNIIKNTQNLLDVKIIKEDENGNKLRNVEFIIKTIHGTTTQYLKLMDSSGNKVEKVEGSVTINKNNTANNVEYKANYVDIEADATVFKTNTDGIIEIKNLENYYSPTITFTYKAKEISNSNYGFKASSNLETEQTLTANGQNTIKNTSEFGNLKLVKVDEFTGDKIPDTEFKIMAGSSFIKLLDENENRIDRIAGTANISKTGIAYKNETTTYYMVVTTTEADATTFVTDSNGQWIVNNLEINNEINYAVKETLATSNYERVETLIEGALIKDKTLYVTKTGFVEDVNATFDNTPRYTDISGYIWEDFGKGKDKIYDNVYTNESSENPQEKDILKSGITVELHKGNTIVSTTTTNLVGRYTFENISISELENYSIVFKYDGLNYTSVMLKNSNTENESRAKEIKTEREELNSRYSKINNSMATALSNIGDNKIISASTEEAGISLRTLYNNNQNENVNLGLRKRTRPDLSLKEYLAAVIVESNGSKVVYSYQKNKEEQDGGAFDVGVDFGKFTGKSPYYATVYKSDVESTIQIGTTMNVWMVYQINVINEASNLKERIYSVKNYYDKEYEISSVGNVFEDGDVVTNSGTKYTQWDENSTIIVDGTELKTTIISFNNNNGTDLENNGDVLSTYIKFKVSDESVRELLNQNETLYNASEINMYETYYKETTYEGSAYVENEDETITCSLNNNLYAGLDESIPGNISLAIRDGKLTYANENSIEDDTGMAPSLILEAQGSRTIEGIVWEDATQYVENKGRYGNGLLDNGENKISNVKAELLDNENKVVKLSDGTDAVTYTDDSGKYSFGVQDVVDGKYKGIIPGEYKVRFTYGEYIDTAEVKKTSKINNEDMDAKEYKSTIITKLNEAFKDNANNKWYIIGKFEGYSDAYDEINTINNDISINNSNYNSNITKTAYTPLMKIDLEHELEDQLDIENPTESGNKFAISCDGIDFGIAKRAKIIANLEKKITNIRIISNNGNVLAEGNPSEQANISFVKAFAELVSAEIDTGLLSGATAEVEYSIVVTNNSEIDYNDTNYYLYGPDAVNLNSIAAKKVKIQITKLVDYLGEGMQLDPDKDNSIWQDAILSSSGIKYVEENILSAVNSAKNEDGSAEYIVKETSTNPIQPGGSAILKMNASKLLSAAKDGLRYENHAEILEYKGTNGRVIENTIPGNYNPVQGGTGIDEGGIQKTENDDSKAVFLITDPTGRKINDMNYIKGILIILIILLLGVVLIKRRIIIIEIMDDKEVGKSQEENK